MADMRLVRPGCVLRGSGLTPPITTTTPPSASASRQLVRILTASSSGQSFRIPDTR